MSKITELIKDKEQISYSVEVSPGISEECIDSLEVDPIFYSVTWHAKSHQCADLNIDPVRTAKLLKNMGKEVLLHVTCDMMTTDYLKQLLITLQENNICNLFLVLGERFDRKTSHFESTIQLIEFIREHTADYFCIGVAGLPDCSDDILMHLKAKIKSGADFIITQAFFDLHVFTTFTKRCRELNIEVPIIPGVFPFETIKQLSSFIDLCKIKVSNNLLQCVQSKEALNTCCADLVVQMVRDLSTKHCVRYFHLFSLNNLQRVNKLTQQT